MGTTYTLIDKVVIRGDIKETRRMINGHAATLLNIIIVGEVWGHEKRVRGSFISKTYSISCLYSMVNEHNPTVATGIYSTRPVVASQSAMELQLKSFLADMLEPVVKTNQGSREVTSTNEMLGNRPAKQGYPRQETEHQT